MRGLTRVIVTSTAISATLCACDDPPPWAAPPQRTVVDESRPFLPSTAHDGWLGDAGLEKGEGVDGGAPEAPPTAASGRPGPAPASEARAGGLWASCYAGFATTNGPVRDVTRLGLICGPVNGMKRLGKTVSGALNPSESATHQIEAAPGSCYRLFATSAGIEDLNLVVSTQQGTEIARDHREDGWAIVDPERPLCTFDAATFTVEVVSEAGDGTYALQVWQLPPSKGR